MNSMAEQAKSEAQAMGIKAFIAEGWPQLHHFNPGPDHGSALRLSSKPYV